MVKCADEIIVLSESARDYFKETYNRDTVLIHNGIEKPQKKEAAPINNSSILHPLAVYCLAVILI